MISQINNFFERRSKRTVGFIAITLTFLLGALDLATHIEMNFLLLYLVPVFLGGWYVSRAMGLYLAIFGSLVWFVADSVGGRAYASPWIAYWNLLMRTGVFVIFATTQAALREKFDDLSRQANRDFLTGLSNSHDFHRLAEEAMERAYGIEPMTLACIEVAGIERVNELLGYPTGDRMLCTIAQAIRQNVPRPNLVGRLAGTTFAVLLPRTDSEAANIMLERLHKELKNDPRKYAQPLNFYISAVACAKAPRTLAELMQEADSQMIRMKNIKDDFIQVATADTRPMLN